MLCHRGRTIVKRYLENKGDGQIFFADQGLENVVLIEKEAVELVRERIKLAVGAYVRNMANRMQGTAEGAESVLAARYLEYEAKNILTISEKRHKRKKKPKHLKETRKKKQPKFLASMAVSYDIDDI